MNIFELTLRLQGFPLGKAKKFLQTIIDKPATELYQWQENKKWEIFNHHYEHNPFYRQLVGPVKPEKWEDIPVLNKRDLQNPLGDMLATGYSLKNVYPSNTSGSSGHPFFFAKDKFSHALAWALIKHRFAQYGLKLNSSQVRFYGIPLDKKSYLTEKLKDWLSNRIRFQVFDLSEEILDRFLQVFKTKKIEYIYGYTSSIVYFARYLLEKRLVLRDVCPSLKVCIVTAEVCTREDKKLLEDALGIRVAIEYGSSELSVMGFEFPNGEMICSDETGFFENISEPDGTTRLLCTSLFNTAFPFIKYSIGDSVDFDYNQDGRKIITRLNGRVNDFVKLPSGKVASGIAVYYASRAILESTGCLKEFVVRQTKLDTFVLDVVASERLSDEEVNDIIEKMEMYLEPELQIEINYVDKIARKSSGKIQHFYSELEA